MSQKGLRNPVSLSGDLLEQVELLVQTRQKDELIKMISSWQPAHIAALLMSIPFKYAEQLFDWIPVELAAESLPEMKKVFRSALLTDTYLPRLVALVNHLDTDDAADVLESLPHDIARLVLKRIDSRDDVERLLGYDSDTAGGMMTTQYVAVTPECSINDAIEAVRKAAEEMDDIHVVFVVDENGRLAGLLTLKRILLSRGNASVGEVMNRDLVSVPSDMDQEDVANIIRHYDLVTLPVVDHDNHLLGVITVDDVIDVIDEEAEEDIMHMSGVSLESEPNLPILYIVKGRLPWLVAGLFGATISGMIVSSFQYAIQEAVILASFIPLVMSTAGNVAIQSSTIAVQGIASGDMMSVSFQRRIMRELSVALVNGLVIAAGLALVIFAASCVIHIEYPMRLAITTAVSIVAVVLLASGMGTSVPFFLDRFGIDPALATGPFLTTSNDILGVVVFFTTAIHVYLH
jgi:magnesium transporter